jgi:hypothetical protein
MSNPPRLRAIGIPALGLLAAGGSMSSEELARATGTQERYVREWLHNQAAGGYVTFNMVLEARP